MTSIKYRHTGLIVFFIATFLLAACKKDNWSRHNREINQDLRKDLLQAINENPELSKFSEYLAKTGYDKVISTSMPFTIWAPDNKALQNLDPATVDNLDELKNFIGYHISTQAYFTSDAVQYGSIKTLSGKNIRFTEKMFEEANITGGDKYVSNGVLHVVNKAISPKPNGWEYMLSCPEGSMQRNFIKSLQYTELDTSNAIILFRDPVTKKPVYQEGSVIPVNRNHYLQRVYDIRSEDKSFTYILLTDNALQNEKAKLLPYFHTESSELTDSLTIWNIVKDLVFDKVYSEDELTSTVTSVNGVRIRFNKNDIVEKRLLSNGVAYVVKNIDYDIFENKIPMITIEGEAPDSLRTPSTPSRKIKKTSSGELFQDMQVSSITSSPDPLYYFRYKFKANSVTYKVYWRAVNDIYTSDINMKVDFNNTRRIGSTITPLASTGYKAVSPVATLQNPYAEMYLGKVTFDTYGELYAFLVSAAAGISSSAPTALTLDYIKLVPVN